jgi:predicted dehydrogenase
MNDLRIGIVGLGNMGSGHANWVRDGQVPGLVLGAVCDRDSEKCKRWPNVQAFTDSRAMIRSGAIDIVLIATPHRSHVDIGADALANGLHVISEKPIGVQVADCKRFIAAYEARPRREQVFAAMFQQRTDGVYVALRELIRSGELGQIRRMSWIVTDWFRTEAYYASGGWRATWSGEGGGVLLNQCPHNLDLLWWLFGQPSKVRGFCSLGRWHDIEVEDAVTAYLEWADGATGTFVTTTGEAPGTNRLEIAAERGRVVVEGGKIRWTRNTVPMSEFSKTTSEGFSMPPRWEIEVPAAGPGASHVTILRNVVAAIRSDTPLIAPAPEGIHSIELANAMLWSSATGQTAELPLDPAVYEAHLAKLAAGSRRKEEPKTAAPAVDFAKSFR